MIQRLAIRFFADKIVWNQNIDNVQITFAERLGVEELSQTWCPSKIWFKTTILLSLSSGQNCKRMIKAFKKNLLPPYRRGTVLISSVVVLLVQASIYRSEPSVNPEPMTETFTRRLCRLTLPVYLPSVQERPH